MFVAVFILSALVVALLPPLFRTPVSFGGLETNNLPGVILGGLAAAGSFAATLRRAGARDAEKAAGEDAGGEPRAGK